MRILWLFCKEKNESSVEIVHRFGAAGCGRQGRATYGGLALVLLRLLVGRHFDLFFRGVGYAFSRLERCTLRQRDEWRYWGGIESSKRLKLLANFAMGDLSWWGEFFRIVGLLVDAKPC